MSVQNEDVLHNFGHFSAKRNVQDDAVCNKGLNLAISRKNASDRSLQPAEKWPNLELRPKRIGG